MTEPSNVTALREWHKLRVGDEEIYDDKTYYPDYIIVKHRLCRRVQLDFETIDYLLQEIDRLRKENYSLNMAEVNRQRIYP